MRYASRPIFVNNSSPGIFRRGLKLIKQYSTPKLSHIPTSEIRKLKRITHIWTVGDRYYKLASEHYGNSKYWWVIAWYNKKPTEAHVRLGDLVFIPKPLEAVLKYYKV